MSRVEGTSSAGLLPASNLASALQHLTLYNVNATTLFRCYTTHLESSTRPSLRRITMISTEIEAWRARIEQSIRERNVVIVK